MFFPKSICFWRCATRCSRSWQLPEAGGAGRRRQRCDNHLREEASPRCRAREAATWCARGTANGAALDAGGGEAHLTRRLSCWERPSLPPQVRPRSPSSPARCAARQQAWTMSPPAGCCDRRRPRQGAVASTLFPSTLSQPKSRGQNQRAYCTDAGLHSRPLDRSCMSLARELLLPARTSWPQKRAHGHRARRAPQGKPTGAAETQ